MNGSSGIDEDDGDSANRPSGEADGADRPEWLRDAVDREGGLDAVAKKLQDGSSRTYVSERSVEDVLATVPEEDASPQRTTGGGIDDVLEHLEAAPNVDPEPAGIPSDRFDDVAVPPELEGEDGEDPGSLVGRDPETVVVVDDDVDDWIAAVETEEDEHHETPDVEAAVEESDGEGLPGLFESLEGTIDDVERKPDDIQRGVHQEDDSPRDDQVGVEDVIRMDDEGRDANGPGPDEAEGTASAFETLSETGDSDPDAVLSGQSVEELVEEAETEPASRDRDGAAIEWERDTPEPETGAPGAGTATDGEAPIRYAETNSTRASEPGDPPGDREGSPAPTGETSERSSPTSPPDPATVAEVVRETDGGRSGTESDDDGVVDRIHSLFSGIVGGSATNG